MSKNPLLLQDYSPALLSLIPMLFAAWSDSVLTPSEIKLLRQKASEIKHLGEGELELIQTWSDPRNPPPRYLFEHWEALLVRASKKLSTKKKKSLVALSMQMARQSARKGDVKAWVNSDEKAALMDLEESLGLVSDTTYERLFANEQSEVAPTYSFDPKQITALLDGET